MIEKLRRFQQFFLGKILDVGAGDQPYRNLFINSTEYLATNTKSHYKGQLDGMNEFTDVWINDASELPFKDGEIDGVLCFQVLSVIKKPELFFEEVQRVLKPGGKFLLTTDFLYPTWSSEDRGRYSKQQLERIIGNSGLKVLKTESFGGIKSLFFSLLSRRIRSYPSRIKDASLISKPFKAFFFFLSLLGLPLISVCGYLTFLIDKNNRNDYDFTFNLLVLSEKSAK
jgi:SAM-dependent methyltransferase